MKQKLFRKMGNTFAVLITLSMLLAACKQYPIPTTGDEPTQTPTSISTAVSDPGSFFTFLPFLNKSTTVTEPANPISTPVAPPAIPPLPPAGDGDWPMVAANPQRSSWTPEEVGGANLHVEWYRPIEAYIPQNVQLIASGGLIYVATSRGLYALNAFSGDLVWRYETELPIGNSPTVSNGVVYFGGYDHKLHALRADNGEPLWSFDGAAAGYSTNPLVVDGRVLLGNRDGYFYAIGANGTPEQGQLLWKYKTGGLIDISAAYANGVVYFASLDNHAYALRVENGNLVWKSALMPGDGYQSFWPVIYGDYVIFSAASGYRTGFSPGTASVKNDAGDGYGKVFDMDRDAVFADLPNSALVGPEVPNQTWANDKTVLDVSAITEYLESDPTANDDLHKPWRRTLIMLNRTDGNEFTFDSDQDGHPEYLPAPMWGTHSGNRYPPVIGPDGLLYFSNIFQRMDIPQGQVVGWRIGTDMVALAGGQGAVDEPQALSVGGDNIYRVICCDRVGDYYSLSSNRAATLWTYNSPLFEQIPGYDEMWYGVPDGDTVRLRGNYGTENGIYNSHGDQNPLIPYQDRLYVHRSNTVIAYGTGATFGEKDLLTIQSPQNTSDPISESVLLSALSNEIQKMLDAGHLRPGYYNTGQFSLYAQLSNYFENPGDTLYTLSLAYPYLSETMKSRVRQYLIEEFELYFDPAMYGRIGWKDGAAREWMPLPPEAQESLENFGPTVTSDGRFSWQYPPFNFYALWKYVQIVPEDVQKAYDLAKSKLVVPLPATITDDILFQRPFEHNAYIAGYLGFLELQELAGKSTEDQVLRTRVTQELNRLQLLRSQSFTVNTYWTINDRYHMRVLNISRNFLYMTPELGDYLRTNAFSRVEAAVDEYNQTAPYWFVARYNAVANEGVRQNLYDYPAMFQAKAYILNDDRAELTKYLDAPAFRVGDLFYIQNLVAALQAE